MTDQVRNSEIDGEVINTSRRQFGIMGAVAAVAGMASPAMAAGKSKTVATKVSVPTPHGQSSAHFFHPEGGRHRGLVMWSDGKAASQKVASNLAGQGWAVLLVTDRNVDGAHADQTISRDARAYVSWLESQAVVAETGKGAGRVGSELGHGYKLRSVAAVLPRLSLASAEERKAAASTATLFAVPDAVVPSHRTAMLDHAARDHRRLSA